MWHQFMRFDFQINQQIGINYIIVSRDKNSIRIACFDVNFILVPVPEELVDEAQFVPVFVFVVKFPTFRLRLQTTNTNWIEIWPNSGWTTNYTYKLWLSKLVVLIIMIWIFNSSWTFETCARDLYAKAPPPVKFLVLRSLSQFIAFLRLSQQKIKNCDIGESWLLSCCRQGDLNFGKWLHTGLKFFLWVKFAWREHVAHTLQHAEEHTSHIVKLYITHRIGLSHCIECGISG